MVRPRPIKRSNSGPLLYGKNNNLRVGGVTPMKSSRPWKESREDHHQMPVINGCGDFRRMEIAPRNRRTDQRAVGTQRKNRTHGAGCGEVILTREFNFFLWLCRHNQVFRATNLAKRGMSMPIACRLCTDQEETSEHLLRQCPIAVNSLEQSRNTLIE